MRGACQKVLSALIIYEACTEEQLLEITGVKDIRRRIKDLDLLGYYIDPIHRKDENGKSLPCLYVLKSYPPKDCSNS